MALLRMICMGKKPIVSVTCENERISIESSLPYSKCVLHLSCVNEGPIYGRLMGFYVNGFLSTIFSLIFLACSKRSDSGERCEVKKAMKSRGGLGREVPPLPIPRFYFFALLFTSHRSPLSERLEQAIIFPAWATCDLVSGNTILTIFILITICCSGVMLCLERCMIPDVLAAFDN